VRARDDPRRRGVPAETGQQHGDAMGGRPPRPFSTDRELAMDEIRNLDQPTPRLVSCQVCQHEIPASEAVVPEAVDYVAYFCGVECFNAWRNRAGASEA